MADSILSDTTHDTYLTVLTCAECGGRMHASPYQPRIRCPFCGSVGYPDRAGQHLLSIGWNCLDCGERNDGLTNFCLSCGVGLTSRCLRCEAPVYTSQCSQCGSPQDSLIKLQRAEAERAIWLPIEQAHLEAELAERAAREQREAKKRRAPAPEAQTVRAPEPLPAVETMPAPPSLPSWVNQWPAVDQQMTHAAQGRTARLAQARADRRAQRQQRRQARKHSPRANPMGMVWMIVGFALLIKQADPELTRVKATLDSVGLLQSVNGIILWFQALWTTITTSGALDLLHRSL